MKVFYVAIITIFISSTLQSQTLWEDHNPYDSSPVLSAGTILKIEVDEPVKIEYEFVDNRDLSTSVKLVPDKTITDFLKPVDSSRSIVTKNKGRVISKNRVVFDMAVNVTGDISKEVVTFSGSKTLAMESGKQQQQIQIQGRVLKSDISSDRKIKSKNVSDLVISIRGAPIPVSANLPVKNEDGVSVAKISEAEKQKLIMDYINKVLGESSNSN